ncbi:MAG: hypothetical protein ACWA40_09365 [Planktomarina sp.]
MTGHFSPRKSNSPSIHAPEMSTPLADVRHSSQPPKARYLTTSARMVLASVGVMGTVSANL